MIWKSIFWHGLMHKAFVANAAFIFRCFLGTTKGKFFTQLSITGLVFIISGVMHLVGSKVAVPTSNGGNIFWFYCLNGLGIIFEDIVRIMYSYLIGNKVESSSSRRLGRAIGYIWTFLFISWSIPRLYLPSR